MAKELTSKEKKLKLHVGNRVIVADKGPGVLKYFGITKASKGAKRCGVELDDPNGTHNGCVNGNSYFVCAEQHGVLSKPENVTIIETVGLRRPKKGSNPQLKPSVKPPAVRRASSTPALLKQPPQSYSEPKSPASDDTPTPSSANGIPKFTKPKLKKKVTKNKGQDSEIELLRMQLEMANQEKEMALLEQQAKTREAEEERNRLEQERATMEAAAKAAADKAERARAQALELERQKQEEEKIEQARVAAIQLAEKEKREKEASLRALAETAAREEAARKELLDMRKQLEETQREQKRQSDDAKEQQLRITEQQQAQALLELVQQKENIEREKQALEKTVELQRLATKAEAERLAALAVEQERVRIQAELEAAASKQRSAEMEAAELENKQAREELARMQEKMKELEAATQAQKEEVHTTTFVNNQSSDEQNSALEAKLAEMQRKLEESENAQALLVKKNKQQMQNLAKKVFMRIQGGSEAVAEAEKEEKEMSRLQKRMLTDTKEKQDEADRLKKQAEADALQAEQQRTNAEQLHKDAQERSRQQEQKMVEMANAEKLRQLQLQQEEDLRLAKIETDIKKFDLSWNCANVTAWLTSIGFSEEAGRFADEDLEAEDITLLLDEDLIELGITNPTRREQFFEVIKKVT